MNSVWKDSTGLTGLLVRGWQLNSIVQRSRHSFASAAPENQSETEHIDFSIHGRPNVRPGASTIRSSAIPSAGYTPSAFVLQPAGTIGNLAEHADGPKLVSCDFSLFKQFALGRPRLHFRAENVNIFDHRTRGTQPSKRMPAAQRHGEPRAISVRHRSERVARRLLYI